MSDVIDNFEQYYAEKIWEMIPEVYRHEDGLAADPDVLRAIVEVVASQAAEVRRSQDRVWDDMFIELASDWVIPYIGDLLSTRMVSALNPRGRRIDVAKTVYYRRRAGTVRVLEELISDITEWEGVVREGFKLLGRTLHNLDNSPTVGNRFVTPSGGTANLRSMNHSALAGTAFDTFYHTADLRRPQGHTGQYGINKVAFHLYRLNALGVADVTPSVAFTDTDKFGYTFDPSGRDMPLFAKRSRPELWDDWRSAKEWELPLPIRCRLLANDAYVVTEGVVLDLKKAFPGVSNAALKELRTIRGLRFEGEYKLRNRLKSFNSAAEFAIADVYQGLLALALQDDTAKADLLPESIRVELDGEVVPTEQIGTGNLKNWDLDAVHKRVIIDTERGRLLVIGTQPEDVSVSYYHGQVGETGAGTYTRAPLDSTDEISTIITGGGAIAASDLDATRISGISDSKTYTSIANKITIQDMALVAASGERPYIRLNSDWILNTGSNEDSMLLLDGLWLGSENSSAVVLRGDYEIVTIRSCTFDPGGMDSDGNAILPVPLIVEGNVERLIIDRCIMAPIVTAGAGVIEVLQLTDSIVQSRQAAIPAIHIPDQGTVDMTRTTVMGRLLVHRLYATEVIVTETAQVTDTQSQNAAVNWGEDIRSGCFRFSAAPRGSRLPRPYESVELQQDRNLFTSSDFGHPAFGQLSQVAPESVSRGAENGSEMGAFSELIYPIKHDSLVAKIQEFLPFGLVPAFIYET